jgi:hypothetical protein
MAITHAVLRAVQRDRLVCNPCPAVFKFLLAQKDLQLTDLTKANLTVADVKISYVHGIWYEVSSRAQMSKL